MSGRRDKTRDNVSLEVLERFFAVAGRALFSGRAQMDALGRLSALPGQIADIIVPRIDAVAEAVRGPESAASNLDVDPTTEDTVVVTQTLYQARETPDPYIVDFVTGQIDAVRFNSMCAEYQQIETALRYVQAVDQQAYAILLGALTGSARVNQAKLDRFVSDMVADGPSLARAVCSSPRGATPWLSQVCAASRR